MELLEYFYNININLTNYYQRKYTIPKESKRLLIYGSPSSGKSYLIFDYLRDNEEFIKAHGEVVKLIRASNDN